MVEGRGRVDREIAVELRIQALADRATVAKYDISVMNGT